MLIFMVVVFDDDLIKCVVESIGMEVCVFGNVGFGGLDYWMFMINLYRDFVCEYNGFFICFFLLWYYGRKVD